MADNPVRPERVCFRHRYVERWCFTFLNSHDFVVEQVRVNYRCQLCKQMLVKTILSANEGDIDFSQFVYSDTIAAANNVIYQNVVFTREVLVSDS